MCKTIWNLKEKYPDFPLFVMIKIEAQRRGIRFTERALRKVNPVIHQLQVRSFSRETDALIPVALILRDGTSIIARVEKNMERKPLLIDVDEKEDIIVIKDGNEVLEQVFYWEKPDYYDKVTKSRIPMWKIVNARPQRLDINPYQFCDMWARNMGCKFCGIAGTYKKSCKPMYLKLQDIDEAFSQALKQPGRYTNIFLTGGINLKGKKMFDEEVDFYIRLLQTIGKYFKTDRFPSQLIGAPYNEYQLKKLYEETGLMSYSANLEVLDAQKFAWICPGKAKYVGYEQWKEHLYQAVEIFGRGNVNTGIVCGVEMAEPYGWSSEEEGIEKTLTEAENLMKYGVDVVSCVWRVAKESLLCNQFQPSLEYYVRMAKGLWLLREKYSLISDMDNYRRCGNHPDTDLQRMGKNGNSIRR